MSTFGLPISLDQPAGQILVVVFFLIPGLNATWVIERLAGRTPLGIAERLFRAVGLSVLIYAMASPWLLRVGHRVATGQSVWPFEPVIGFALLVFVAPLGLGFIWAQARRSGLMRRLVQRLTPIDPSPTPWDFVFSRREGYMVRIKFHGGERMGGVFGAGSKVSRYPEPQEIYLEEVWRLAEDGGFLEPVGGSRGMLVRREDVEVLELLRVRLKAVADAEV